MFYLSRKQKHKVCFCAPSAIGASRTTQALSGAWRAFDRNGARFALCTHSASALSLSTLWLARSRLQRCSWLQAPDMGWL